MLKFTDGKEVFRNAQDGQTVDILIVGDCCPWHDAIEPVKNGLSSDILHDIQPVLDACDLSLIQFETPLTEHDGAIDKSGPNLKCPPECVDFVKTAGFDVALLANNHTGDFGPEPVEETISLLEKHGIKTVGAGKNLAAACRPLFVKKNGFKIGIINVAENEFGTAGKNKAGAAPLQPLENIRTIRQVSAEADITLVVLHGGNETNPIPSPRMVRTCRAFVEAGADAVINIHTHCPQGIEIWEGAPIIYCPGNFFFPSPWRTFDPENFWWTGYLPKISFDRQGAFALEITPFTFRTKPEKIEPFIGAKKVRFCQYLAQISAIIPDDSELQKYYDGWCAMMGPSAIAGTLS
ncbi:MAG: CapA family protein, partial [Victivallaceae bacterium]